jgi:outer membrane lipoprotein-sorting protein
MNILRRLPLSRLLLLCGVVVVVGIGATALALAVGTGPTPPPKPLADAIHDAFAAPKVSGVSARIQFTNHLLEGANLASGGGESSQLSSSPLISGASGRLWIGSEGHARLELQSEKGDTQILWDGKTAELYDASTNTLYRYTPTSQSASAGEDDHPCPQGAAGGSCATYGEGQGGKLGVAQPEIQRSPQTGRPVVPSVAEIEEGISHATKHADISSATPTDVAGQAAYTVRVSPRENGGLIAGAELSWDSTTGVPLRAALYSTNGAAPVIELAATEISYGPVEGSVLDFTPPANAKVEEVTLPNKQDSGTTGSPSGERPHVSTHGQGLGAIVLAESPVKGGAKESETSLPEGLQKVDIGGTTASELPTQLGTLLSFERAGVRYLLVGSVTPSSIEAFARGL